MTLLVPYDGSSLSKAALIRAAQFDSVLEQGVVALTVIPRNNARYARDRGWIGPEDPFEEDAVVTALEQSVAEIVDDAEFEYRTVDRTAPFGTVAKRIRRFADEIDATIVFLGSDNAGRMVGSLSVGSAVTAGDGYDTMIVSQPAPSRIDRLEAALPSEGLLDGEQPSADATR